MKLHSLSPATGATKTRKRIGRGQGSGRGGTSTKGHKGQQARSGYNYRPWFEGGQMPLQRRIPKFGFKNFTRVEYKVINLDTIQQLLEAYPGEEVNHDFLLAHGIISTTSKLVKVLGRGEITVKANVKLNKYSQSARAAIEAAGGTVTEA
ncbi:MAG: 50S ribosomal protein L15 [Bacteroidia bacterium]|jgi:large subunit ribosomal protein L15|nr:50S ribosomal protein L15 [Bacteroidia bacterium]